MAEFEYIIGDSLKKLDDYDDNFFKLIITSPPYNVGKEYETKQSIEHYLKDQEKIIAKLVAKLSNNGSLCWQVGNYVHKKEIFPLDIFYYNIFKGLGLKLRN